MAGFFINLNLFIMARVQNTLIGRSSGSVGQVVFLTWRSINVTRAKPTHVHNPNTIPQQSYRNKYGFAVGLYNQLKPVIDAGLGKYALKMSVQNFFLKKNLGISITTAGTPDIAFFPKLFIVSYGLFQTTAIVNVLNIVSSGIMQVRFSVTPKGVQSSTDVMYAIGFNQTTNKWVYSESPSLRSVGNVVVEFPDVYLATDVSHFWLFSKSSSSGMLSDSTYRLR